MGRTRSRVPQPIRDRLRRLRQRLSWHRRLLAALLATTAVAAGLQALRPDPPPTVPVLVAARDLPSGRHLSPGDLQVRELPAAAAPDGALRRARQATGRVLAGPTRSGEPVTDVRLLGRARLRSYGPDVVAAAVRLSDPGLLRVLRVGDRVDVIAAPTSPGVRPAGLDAEVLVRSAPVLALPDGDDAGSAPSVISTAGGRGLVLLAVTPKVATDLARAAVTSRVSLVLRAT